MLTPSKIAEMAAVKYPLMETNNVMGQLKECIELHNQTQLDMREGYIAAFTDAIELMSKEVEQAFIEYEQTTSSPLDVSLDELLAKVKSKFLPEPPVLTKGKKI